MTALSRYSTAIAWAILLWLLLMAFAHPVSHDESQYVAATALVARGLLPYRDFAYLQTPLQPFIFAPLAWTSVGALLVMSRLANATLAGATLALVYSAARRGGADRGAALAASILLLTSHAFLWASGVARNDMLPAALLTAALWVEMRGKRRLQHWVAGAALGLAAAAKVSYALPAAAVPIALFMDKYPAERRSAIWLCFGALVGSSPAVLVAFTSPHAFLFEVFTFGLEGPGRWYRELGEDWMLGPFRFAYLLGVAAMGPALLAAVTVAVRVAKAPHRWLQDRQRRLLVGAMLGGVVSAALNRPFNTPYLVPALPPLFILIALELTEQRLPPPTLRVAGAASIAIGLVWPASCLGEAAIHGRFQLVDAEQRSKEIKRALQANDVEGPVAGLTGQYLVDSGHPLDARFAAGPFLFRSVGLLPAEQAREWHIVTWDQYAALASSPPGAIITGGEANKRVEPDLRLAAIAASLGYRPVAHVRKYTIWRRTPAGP